MISRPSVAEGAAAGEPEDPDIAHWRKIYRENVTGRPPEEIAADLQMLDRIAAKRRKKAVVATEAEAIQSLGELITLNGVAV